MSFRRNLQSNAVARIWALLACGFFGGAAYYLHKVREHRIAQGGSDATRDVLLYFLLVVLSGVHLVVLYFPLWLRRSRIARMVPPPFCMGLGCTVTALVPLACTVDGRLSDESMTRDSLWVTLFFTVDFFCLQMVVLPAFEYMFVHTSLALLQTVVLSVTRVQEWRPLWLSVAAFGCCCFLSLHHWLTIPAPARDGQTVNVDLRFEQSLAPLVASDLGQPPPPSTLIEQVLQFVSEHFLSLFLRFVYVIIVALVVHLFVMSRW
ncbi:uncharacterized protein LOC110714178 [Chenopodium quinoa]|uniref:uncharacterized protein LOC110714178 n=1 Tax=Chenopodium quinoa TaxID=63459 RepID=UPI000B77E197|nr:uncharacterized protein LOC110714178 [Chenopodium quinoa]XP_021748351.1 uncharacterized protein LOC110714178 [Chenopodium quinoa]